MPTWLINIMAKIAASGILTIMTSRRGLLLCGFLLLVLGSMFSSIPFVLIGAFTMLWSTTRAIEDMD